MSDLIPIEDLKSKLQVEFKAVDEELQVVYGEVYIPMEMDTQGDFAAKEAIRKMAWGFLSEGRHTKIDVQHDFKESGAVVVESFIARKGDPTFTEGAWILATKLPDDLWEKVKKGELNGYSLAGYLEKVEVDVAVEQESVVNGSTAPAEDGHTHKYTVAFDNKGYVMYGAAFDDGAGHTHKISGATATDIAEGHAHRIEL